MFSRSPTRPSEPYSVESLYSLRERHYPRREIGQWRHPQAADDGQWPLRLRHLGKKVDRDESGRLEHEAYEHPQDGERRRIKCDEGKPKCAQCSKSDRDCQYAQAPTSENDSETHRRADSTVSNADQSAEADSVEDAVPTTEPAESALATSPAAADTTASPAARPVDLTAPFVSSFNPAGPLSVDNSALQPTAVSDADLGFSPLALSQTSLLNISPFEWYDLLAQDAINNIQRLNSLPNGEVRWVFDESTLSRRQTPLPESPTEQDDQLPIFGRSEGHTTPPWNTSSNTELSDDELVHFRYYVDVVGPILDLFDPERHFSNMVPHLAVRNAGLLKSILAVAARHMSLGPNPKVSNSGVTCPPLADSSLAGSPAQEEAARSATQYYYETLQYLSHTLLYPSYANSHEILATAIMISTYEMFDSNGPSNNGDWERHLRGAFWIQRSQDNNAESADSFRRAVWWAWIRQDIWAAFRSGRRTLTIFQPQKTLQELNPDDLASRVLFIAAKCVAYAAYDASSSTQDLQQRMNLGNRLLRSLEEWREALPASFAPISGGAVSDTVSGASRPSSASPSVHHVGQAPGPAATQGKGVFEPIWIHPPRNAGAMQMYHFARSVVLLAQPSTGGLNAYRRRQRLLNESLHRVCGVAKACNDNDPALAFLNVQVMFAVGQCAQNGEKQTELLETLNRAVAISSFPSKGLTDELERIWKEGF
ncbi:Sterol uptake control protein 2 [Colletotrichum aenigma]|uniref:Sterol uptake control protein 2 n=1 Tax=Colletotrichum aenigma TaxID=1215731 RepID=UPI0018731B47|nr:Sterol uptake control protein 2 [Colletotrichum aenigma]KAF5502655.1 Sterol uptake control protein 2 [Colletotrichum aenigma]